jgi:hypothetical protein
MSHDRVYTAIKLVSFFDPSPFYLVCKGGGILHVVEGIIVYKSDIGGGDDFELVSN